MSDNFPFTENPEDAWSGDAQNQEDEQVSEADMAKAISLVEQGQAIDQVIGSMFGSLPEHIKQIVKQKLQQIAQAKQTREHEMAQQTRQKQNDRKMGFSKLFTLNMLGAVISRETIEKIQQIFAKNPQLQQEVGRQGMNMLEKGVQPDVEAATDIPTMASSPSLAQEKPKEPQR